MSTNTKALQLQKCEWLRALRDGSGKQAKDILATVIVKTTAQQTRVVRAFQAAFANPICIQKHLVGQSYLIKLLEEQLVRAKNEGVDDATCTSDIDQQRRDEACSEGSHADGEGSRVDESDEESLTAAFKTPRPAASSKKSSKANGSITAKSKKQSKKHKARLNPIAPDSDQEQGRPDDAAELLRVRKKKGKMPARPRNVEANVNKENEEIEAADATSETSGPKQVSKVKSKSRRKAEKSQAKDLAMDKAQAQAPSKSSLQHAQEGSKRKAGVDDPETPVRSTKKARRSKKGANEPAQLPMRPRTHSATPGPSKAAEKLKSETRPAANDGAQSNVDPKMEEESDGGFQMFSAPTTPFRQYQPINIRPGDSDSHSSIRQDGHMFIDLSPSRAIRSVEDEDPKLDHSPHVNLHQKREIASNSRAQHFSPNPQQPQLQGPAQHQTKINSRLQAQLSQAASFQPQQVSLGTRTAPTIAVTQPYRDPQGERQYKCKQCASWFVYSDNPQGGCRARHLGSALLITSRARNARKWTCCGRIGNGHPYQNGCVDQPHTWNGVDFTPREQPRRGLFEGGS